MTENELAKNISAHPPVPAVNITTPAPTPKSEPALDSSNNQSKAIPNIVVVGFVLAFTLPIAGLVISIIAALKVKKGQHGRGLVIAGIVISIFSLVFELVMLFFLLLIGGAH